MQSVLDHGYLDALVIVNSFSKNFLQETCRPLTDHFKARVGQLRDDANDQRQVKVLMLYSGLVFHLTFLTKEIKLKERTGK